MKIRIIVICLAVLFAACGKSHTYKGVLERVGSVTLKGNVEVTIRELSDKEAILTIKGNTQGILEQCEHGVKLQKTERDGKIYWRPDYCTVKKADLDLKDDYYLTGDIEIIGNRMIWIVNASSGNNMVSFQFDGKE